MGGEAIKVNRAPVLTLWGSVVAERMGYGREEALSLGKALAGLNAQAKGRSLGIYGPPKGERGGEPKKAGLGEEFWVELCGRPLPAKETEDGVRAVVKDKPVEAGPVEVYLAKKFGEHLEDVRAAMAELAASFGPEELSEAAYGLYERFRPEIAGGRRGWGQKGALDLALIRSLAKQG
jgi:hypothetical protein